MEKRSSRTGNFIKPAEVMSSETLLRATMNSNLHPDQLPQANESDDVDDQIWDSIDLSQITTPTLSCQQSED